MSVVLSEIFGTLVFEIEIYALLISKNILSEALINILQESVLAI